MRFTSIRISQNEKSTIIFLSENVRKELFAKSFYLWYCATRSTNNLKMTVNQLTTISKIKKAFPAFFSKCQRDAFKSRAYDSVKVTESGTYFITSEIFKYERIGEHEVIHHEKDRVFKVRFANEKDIYIIEKFDTFHRAKIYLDKLDHDTGGYRISQHEANQAKLRILGVK